MPGTNIQIPNTESKYWVLTLAKLSATPAPFLLELPGPDEAPDLVDEGGHHLAVGRLGGAQGELSACWRGDLEWSQVFFST
jgi:hypothetical protein